MINIQKIPFLKGIALVFNLISLHYYGGCQQIELHTTQGKLVFELTDIQGFIKNPLLAGFAQVHADSITLSGAFPEYMASLETPLPAIPVADSIELSPVGPHYRGVLTAPIDVDLKGNRTIRLDRLLLVHGKTYSYAYVKSLNETFYNKTAQELFVRLYDTIIKYRFTPLADTLKDRFGRPVRGKIKVASRKLMDSLATQFTLPVYTQGEMVGYEMEKGLPALDGRYLVIAVLKDDEKTLNRIMDEAVNQKRRYYWKLVTR